MIANTSPAEAPAGYAFRSDAGEEDTRTMTSSTVLTDREGSVGIITLNRPEAMNALSFALTAALDRSIEELEDDPAINVLVITGAGERAFCAGGDIKEMANRERRP